MSLKKNLVANYIGQGWQALMGLAFVPLYIRYLGVEAYGLIGIFALLQAWLTLLEMGMKPALGREMARFTAGAHNAQSIRDLLRSIELIGIAIAGAVGLGIWAASGWLATHWVRVKNLPVEVVAHAFAVMGLVAALRFIEDIYVSSIAGLQRQVLQNIVTSIMATTRGLGAVALLVWVSPTIEAFFLWQGLISVMTVALFSGVVHHILPPAPVPSRFSGSALLGIWRFAAGMMTITFLALLLTQVDKILLSRLLTLESFGYYALAWALANALNMLAMPITGAFYPRFTELAANGDDLALRALYHQGAQLVTVLNGSAAMMLMVFSDRILRLWTGNPVLTQHVAPVMLVLALGMMFSGMMAIPYQMQLAHGWTSLTIKINIVSVGLLVPAILLVAPAHGAIGTAWVWVTLNVGYVLFEIPLMHRRFLRAEKWRWYRQDTALPLAAAAATALLCRWAMPHGLGKVGEFSVLMAASVCVLSTAVAAAPLARHQLIRYVRRYPPALQPALPEAVDHK
jgi:O-antigen/teichoic acid export membrane protein